MHWEIAHEKNQIGATLIIVLLLLVAITIIGSLAVRSSILSLKGCNS